MSYLAWTLSAFCGVAAFGIGMGWWEASSQISATVLWGFASVYSLIGLGMIK